MSLKPLNDNIIIEQDEMEFVDENPEVQRILKEGTIIAPDKNSAIKSANTGTIVSWGDRCNYKYKVGQKIMFGRFGGSNFFHNDKKYRMLKEWELLAIYESE